MKSERPVVIVGLGPGPEEAASQQALEAVRGRSSVYVTAPGHPAARLVREPLMLPPELGGDPATVAGFLTKEASGGEHPVIFAVPGSPFVAEPIVSRLLATSANDIQVIPGASFLDTLWGRLGVEPFDSGIRLMPADRVGADTLTASHPVIITDLTPVSVDGLSALAEKKPTLDVVVAHHVGLPDESLLQVPLTARPPGTRRVSLDAILRLPRRPALIAEVLDRAGLGPQVERAEITRLARQMVALASSCAHCLAWKADGARLCLPCQRFKQAHRQAGVCAGCGRNLPLQQGRCRMCLYALAHIGEQALTSGVQLWMDGAGLRPRWRGYRLVTGQDGIRRPVAAEETADRRQPIASPAIPTAGQLALFPAPPRHWEVLHQRELPALSDRAEALRRELAQLAARQQWRPRVASAHQRTLTMITAWLGVDAPIEEADLWAIARLGNSYSARRLIPFLTERGLLIPDHMRHADPHRAGVARLRRRIPAHLLPEIDVWIAVLRGEGKRPSHPFPWKTVNGYLGYATPVLELWGPSVTSLREITTAHVQEALDNASGVDGVFTALRSLFKALKRERVVFHDPARSATFTFRAAVRRPVPSDRLVGLIDRVPTASGRVAVALTAIHALRAHTFRGALLSDLNRSKGTLGVRGVSGRQKRIVYLDDFTLSLIATMLKERATRWPNSTNPHLLVTRVTAHDPAGPQMSHKAFQYFFRRLGTNAEQVRIDRILDEARATADPVHLMTVFGITEDTAMDYLASAHPERFPTNPIAP